MQTVVVFTPPEPARPSSTPRPDATPAAEWRAAWVGRGIGTYDQWNAVRVVSLRDRLTLVAGTPDASTWLRSQLDEIAGVVADAVGATVGVDVRDQPIGVRHSDDQLWGYRLPDVVVAKSSTKWTPHFAAVIDPELRDQMARKFERSIRDELRAWNRLPDELANDEPFLVVSDPGLAHGVPAISGDRSGHGKTVSVLARRHVWLLSYWRFDGNLFAGSLASLGFGRMIRCIPSDHLDRYTQKALLRLPSTAKELR